MPRRRTPAALYKASAPKGPVGEAVLDPHLRLRVEGHRATLPDHGYASCSAIHVLTSRCGRSNTTSQKPSVRGDSPCPRRRSTHSRMTPFPAISINQWVCCQLPSASTRPIIKSRSRCHRRRRNWMSQKRGFSSGGRGGDAVSAGVRPPFFGPRRFVAVSSGVLDTTTSSHSSAGPKASPGRPLRWLRRQGGADLLRGQR